MGAPFAMTLPFDNSTPLPKAMTGRWETDMAHAMAAALAGAELASAADALDHLRRAFPQVPLRTRIAAAHVLLERLRQSFP